MPLLIPLMSSEHVRSAEDRRAHNPEGTFLLLVFIIRNKKLIVLQPLDRNQNVLF